MPTTPCWFKHQTSARDNCKLLKIQQTKGELAYAIFFKLLELMRERSDMALFIDDFRVYREQMHSRCSADALRCYAECMIEIGLFKSDGKKFWSDRLIAEAAEYERIREKKREAGKKRWAKKSEGCSTSSASAKQMLNEGSDLKDRKGKRVSSRWTEYREPGQEELRRLEAAFGEDLVMKSLTTLRNYCKSEGKHSQDWPAYRENWIRRDYDKVNGNDCGRVNPKANRAKEAILTSDSL